MSLVSKISKSNQLLSHCNNKQKAKYTQAGVGTIVLLVPIKKNDLRYIFIIAQTDSVP